MGYASGQPVLWPIDPNWINAVDEQLAWLNDVMAAKNGAQQARAIRAIPRRSLSMHVLAQGDQRRLLDVLAFDLGVSPFELPIWADAQVLASALASTATSVSCETDGYDFADGGKAVLYESPTSWEIIHIATVGTSTLVLSAATVASWPAGTRLYPLRRARLAQPVQMTDLTDDVMSAQVSVLFDEPCSWPAAWPVAVTYRTHPVLDLRGDESKSPGHQYERLITRVDDDFGPVYYNDQASMPFRGQSMQWLVSGRDDHARLRSFLYALAGRAGQVWVPSWQADVHLIANVGASDTTLSVAWMGNTLFGQQAVNRRDLRLELFDGTVFYRRVTASISAGSAETLTMDSALGQDVAMTDIRQISWMTLSSLSSDTVTIQHLTDADGLARCELHFEALKNDV